MLHTVRTSLQSTNGIVVMYILHALLVCTVVLFGSFLCLHFANPIQIFTTLERRLNECMEIQYEIIYLDFYLILISTESMRFKN